MSRHIVCSARRRRAASHTGARRQAEHRARGLRRASVGVGLDCRGEPAQAVGKRRTLRRGECSESETAPGHEVRVAAKLPLPPHHRAPDDLGGEAERPARRREIKGAGRTEAEEVKMFDLRAGGAEVEEADVSETPHARDWAFGQTRARQCPPFLSLGHRSLTSTRGDTLPQKAGSHTDIAAARRPERVGEVARRARRSACGGSSCHSSPTSITMCPS